VKLNLALLMALALSVAANLAIKDDPARRNVEVLPEMVRHVAYESFSPNPNFADGKTLQPPPEGSIARGAHPVHYAATPEDAVRAGRELAVPPGASMERGTHVYQVYCQPCHGGAGKGDGPVAMHGFPPPPSLLADHAKRLSGGQMFHVVTYGQKNMPAYAAQVPVEDRWSVIAYVRSLQQTPGSPAQEAAKQ
jgi:mono/diheme cytochrome c family protein